MTGELGRNLYDLLGVQQSASAIDIKNAYRTLARQLHPDISPGTEDEFRAVQNAYETLSNTSRRLTYDAQLAADAAEAERRLRPDSPSTSPHPNPVQAADASRRVYVRVPTAPPPGAGWGTPVSGGWTPEPPAPSLPKRRVARPREVWRALPSAFGAVAAALTLRLTGVSTLVGVRRFDLDEIPAGSLLSLVGLLALGALVMSVVATGVYWLRRSLAPTPVAESVALAAALFLLVLLLDPIAQSALAKLALLATVALYVTWVRMLYRLPIPATTEQWLSFRLWATAVAATFRRYGVVPATGWLNAARWRK